MSPDLFHRLELHVAFGQQSLLRLLRKLRALDYPSESGPLLLDRLITSTQNQQTTLHDIRSLYSSDPVGATERLQSEHRKIVVRLRYLEFLENAQTGRVPWSLVPTLERLAHELYPDNQLLTTSADSLNYSMNWVSSPDGRPVPQSVMILVLPRLHRLNVFLHVLIGHELFHPIVPSFLLGEQPAVVARMKTQVDALFAGHPSHGPLFDQTRLDLTLETARLIWSRAMEELICDLGCAAAFGPAAVFSSASFFLAATLDNPPESPRFYPPSRFRLRAIIENVLDPSEGQPALDRLLDDLAKDSDNQLMVRSIRDYLGALRAEIADDSDMKALAAHQLMTIAYKEVTALLPRAWGFVREFSRERNMYWQDALPQVTVHIPYLRALLPSGEVRQPGAIQGSPASILALALAGWFCELERLAAAPSPQDEEAIRLYSRGCRLLLKSMEDAELRRVLVERGFVGQLS